jgi:hypothetical protein
VQHPIVAKRHAGRSQNFAFRGANRPLRRKPLSGPGPAAQNRHIRPTTKENAMLQQILTHTPLWVWAVLAFVLYRGLLASVDREIALKRVFVIPVVMFALALQGIVSGFGAVPAAAPAWFACMLAGVALAWRAFDCDSVRIDPLRRVISQRGSWTPLLMMMGIFCIKYAVGVALSLQPGLTQQLWFAVSVCALYGLFNGIFFGQALRVAALYRRASLPQDIVPTL